MLRKNLLGNQLDDEQEAEGDDDQIVHIAENRDEIRDQVNGAKQVPHDERCEQLDVPGRPRVFGRQVNGMSVEPKLGARSFQDSTIGKARD